MGRRPPERDMSRGNRNGSLDADTVKGLPVRREFLSR